MAIERDLKITLLPIDIKYADWRTNLTCFTDASKSITGVDIIVLPELFSTGFVRNPSEAKELALQAEGPTLKCLEEIATKAKCAVAGSMMHVEDDKIYNRAFFVEPNGDKHFYDKRHLFTLGAEGEVFAAGKSLPAIVRYRGWNIALAVCYDLRFPVWLRNAGLKYDLLLVPANWPDQRAFAWTHLLQARAIENQAYVAGANRSGADKMGQYDHQSYICDYMGNMIGDQDGSAIAASLSKKELNSFREKFAFWNDADEFEILGLG